MIADTDEYRVAIPKETTSLLPRHSSYTSTMTSNNQPSGKPRAWQKNAILLILVYFLLQLQRTIFAGLFIALQQRASCYAYYTKHSPVWVGPEEDSIRLSCLLYEPIRREMTGLLDWDRIFSVMPGKWPCPGVSCNLGWEQTMS